MGVKGRMWRVIKKMVESSKSGVLLEGEKSDTFKIEQGVAQGCSLSPIFNPRRACAARVTVVVLCVCLYVCLSKHAILAVRAIRSITKDAIVLSVRFSAILKRRFS